MSSTRGLGEVDELGATQFAQMIIDAAQGPILTSQPATVLSYDKETQTATVQPVIQVYEVFWESEEEGFAPLESATVPVCFPGSGAFSITWPIEPGTQGVLVFCDRSMSAWMSSGGESVEPADRSRFDESNAFFIPEIRSAATPRDPSAVDDDHCVFKMGLNQRVLIADATANKALALAEGVQARLNAIETAFNLHTHPIVTIPITGVADPITGVVTGSASGTTGAGPSAGTTLLTDVANTRVFVDQ